MSQWASSDCTRSQISCMPSNKVKNYNSENSYSLALNKQVLINSWDQRNVFEFQGNMNKNPLKITFHYIVTMKLNGEMSAAHNNLWRRQRFLHMCMKRINYTFYPQPGLLLVSSLFLLYLLSPGLSHSSLWCPLQCKGLVPA